jgi:predicted flap endonuclease-1-like 5' DNA nuclease
MSLPAGIVLGILIGWLVEWIIDWIYWRPKRKLAVQSVPETRAAALPIRENTAEVDALRAENARLKSQLEKNTNVPDDLKVIKGIGPEIERRLNQAGIMSFAQLAELTPTDLERILGESIKRLANEQDLLDQARTLANVGR